MSWWAEGDANVDKGDGSGLSCMLEGAGSWLESRAGAWTGREQSREQPGSDCSLVFAFHTQSPSLQCLCVVIWEGQFHRTGSNCQLKDESKNFSGERGG